MTGSTIDLTIEPVTGSDNYGINSTNLDLPPKKKTIRIHSLFLAGLKHSNFTVFFPPCLFGNIIPLTEVACSLWHPR